METILSPQQAKHGRWQQFCRSPIFDILQFTVLVSLMVLFFVRGTERLGYNWQWYQVPKYILTRTAEGISAGPLINGLIVTLKLSGISLVLALVIGLATALMRLSESPVARMTARGYLETTRNTPLLIQLFFIYFVAGPVVGLERFPSAVLSLSLFEGAYASEIFRAGIESIHRGQWEASKSLGLTTPDTYRFVILPQAVRRVLPPLTGQGISLIKDSALVSTIAIYDLTMQTQAIIAETFLTFELWFTTAAMYLAVTITLSFLSAFMEKRLQISE